MIPGWVVEIRWRTGNDDWWRWAPVEPLTVHVTRRSAARWCRRRAPLLAVSRLVRLHIQYRIVPVDPDLRPSLGVAP